MVARNVEKTQADVAVVRTTDQTAGTIDRMRTFQINILATRELILTLRYSCRDGRISKNQTLRNMLVISPNTLDQTTVLRLPLNGISNYFSWVYNI